MNGQERVIIFIDGSNFYSGLRIISEKLKK